MGLGCRAGWSEEAMLLQIVLAEELFVPLPLDGLDGGGSTAPRAELLLPPQDLRRRGATRRAAAAAAGRSGSRRGRTWGGAHHVPRRPRRLTRTPSHASTCDSRV